MRWGFKTAAVLLCSVCLWGFSADVIGAAKQKGVNHAENAYEAGMTAYGKQEYQNAVYAFQNSIDYDPKLYKSHYMLGMALLMNNETESALRILKTAVNQFPQEWRAQALLGEYYASTREYDTSISYYKQALDSKKMTKDEKTNWQKKLTAVENEQASKWRVSEDEKSKILKAVETKLERKWRPAIVEKRGEDLHMVFADRDDDYRNDKWKAVIDLKCYTAKREFGYQYVNERVVADYRSMDAELDTIEQDADARFFETRVNAKPKLYVVGRIFNSPLGYCLAQYQSRSKIKEKDVSDWVETLRNFRVNSYH